MATKKVAPVVADLAKASGVATADVAAVLEQLGLAEIIKRAGVKGTSLKTGDLRLSVRAGKLLVAA